MIRSLSARFFKSQPEDVVKGQCQKAFANVIPFGDPVMDMLESVRKVLETYYVLLYMLRAKVVETTRAIVSQAELNPPPRDKKNRFADGLYLANDGRKLVVWLYGPGNKYRMGPLYPTLEVEPLRIFIRKVTMAAKLGQEQGKPATFLPPGFDFQHLEGTLNIFDKVCLRVIQEGQDQASRLAGNDQVLPFGLQRGQSSDKNCPMLYLDDGLAGFYPGPDQKVHLTGERVTDSFEHFEFFLRQLLITG